LPSLYRQHIRCRALAGIRSQLLDQPSRDFYAALVEDLDPRAELRFSVLELDGRPIAYNFGFQLDDTFVHYTPTFDVEFFDLSPGQVLLRHLFLYVQANGIREFDFTVGDETYKSRYANHIQRNYSLLVYPRTAKGRLAHAAHDAKERLRKHPSAYRAAKDAASAIRSSAARISRAVRRDGLLRSAGKFAVRLFRSAIYARDEMILYTLTAPDVAPAPQGLTFRVATLGDLADAAVTYPEYLGDNTLHDLRKRIKKGHTPFVALDDGSIVHIVWLRLEDRVATSELGEDFAVEFGRSMGIMYDAWTPQVARGRGIYPAVLSLLCRQIRGSASEPLIYVESDNIASRRGVEKAGMTVYKRMIRSTWFHWIRHRAVREPLQNR
jgi:predicted GNAT family acetyltransferase